MKAESDKNDENIISPITDECIAEIIQIAECCDLSAWTFGDYLDEINRADSFGFVQTENKIEDESNILNQSRGIAGFILARLIKNSDNYLTNYSLNEEAGINSLQHLQYTECEILNIAVRPTAQKRGIGQKLLDSVFEVCFRQQVRYIWLEVRKNNENAITFYRKNNFQPVYTRKNYYRDPVDDALVMKAELFSPVFAFPIKLI